jgi:YidC/Oxa1 family membrane protein insertase
LNLQSKPNKRLSWVVAAAAVLSLTGCGLYPSGPNKWPHGTWGDILQFVSSVIDYFAHLLWNNYGLALLVVTIIIRLLILPLMVKQIRFSKMLQQMQPELQKIKEKYQGDPRKQQEETMKLYQQAGVNPLAGCFPMLLQLPILYALFGAIEGNKGLYESTFLGIFHLGHPDTTYIIPIIAAITTYLSQRVMMTSTDPQQKMMLVIFPVMILFMATRFPSGLALYWIYGNIFTAVQTYFIRVRPVAKEKAEAAAVSGGSGAKMNKPSKKGSSK